MEARKEDEVENREGETIEKEDGEEGMKEEEEGTDSAGLVLPQVSSTLVSYPHTDMQVWE